MQVPSGIIYSNDDLALLRHMAMVRFIRYSQDPFKLKSGIMSNIYVFGREDLTDNPLLEWKIGQKIAEIVYSHTDDNRQPCLIGLPTAGTALAQAAAMASVMIADIRHDGQPLIAHRIMREQLKGHGAHKGTWVNGKPDLVRHQYWTVDNVATDGATKIEAAPKLEEDGYPAKQMPVLIFVDRQQGAVKRLRDEGFEQIHIAYNLLDITYAFGEMDVWPKDAVEAVEEEVRQHQLAV